jgi:hypothetical protein
MGPRPTAFDRAAALQSDAEDPLLAVVQRASEQVEGAMGALEQRALLYLQSGFPLHLRGPAGSGKTTLALRLAEKLKRPVMMLVQRGRHAHPPGGGSLYFQRDEGGKRNGIGVARPHPDRCLHGRLHPGL